MPWPCQTQLCALERADDQWLLLTAVLRWSEGQGIGSNTPGPWPKGQHPVSERDGYPFDKALPIISRQTLAANLSIDFCLGTPTAIQSLIKSEEFSF